MCIGVAIFLVIEGIVIVYANLPDPDDKDVNYCIVLGAGIFSDGTAEPFT